MSPVPVSAGARLLDILQARFTPHFVSLPAATLTHISPTSVGRRLLKVAGYSIVRLLGNVLRPIRNRQSLHGVPWLYVVSPNNVDALRFVERGLPGAVLVAGQGKSLGRYSAIVNRLSLRRKVLHYGQLPAVWQYIKGAVGQPAVRFFDLIFAAIGYYEVYRRALRHYRPSAVIFANDHNDDARALLLACQAEGVATAYVQHASVSPWFPPLGFDLSLLEGQHALDTYRQCGPISGKVALVGMPKADAYLPLRNTASAVSRVAIAANLLDPTDALLAALEAVLPVFPDLTFTFRAHPGDARNFPRLLRTRFPQLLISEAHTESIFEFLTRHDALIAADTSTHLEATLLNLVSFYFRFGAARGFTDDYYGFVRHRLVESVDSLPTLIVKLKEVAQHKSTVYYQRAAYYCSTLGTSAEGHSEDLALDELKTWLTMVS